MDKRRIGILIVAIMFALGSVGCAQQEVVDVIPEEIATPEPTAVPTPTPEPEPTPLPVRPQIEGSETLLAALKHLGVMEIDLTKTYSAQEIITIVVKALGYEKAALRNNFQHPYESVTDEYDPYVGYAYATWLLTGFYPEELKAEDEADDAMLTAMLLRALGYKDYGNEAADFNKENMYEIAGELGISKEDSDYPVRGDDLVNMLWAAMNSKMKDAEDEEDTLMDDMEDRDVISSRDIRHAREEIEEATEHKDDSDGDSRKESDSKPASKPASKPDKDDEDTGSSSGGGSSGGGGGSSGGGSSSGGGGGSSSGGGGGSSGGGGGSSSGGGGSSSGGDSGGSSSGGDSGGSSSGGDSGGSSSGGDSGGDTGGGGAGGDNETGGVVFG